jgi:hypothetical protein
VIAGAVLLGSSVSSSTLYEHDCPFNPATMMEVCGPVTQRTTVRVDPFGLSLGVPMAALGLALVAHGAWAIAKDRRTGWATLQLTPGVVQAGADRGPGLWLTARF